MVMAQSLFIDLKQCRSDCRIDVLAPAWTGVLIDRMPQVQRLVSADFSHGRLSLGERIRLGRELRAERYDQAIVLPNSLKSALVPAVAKITTRTGFIGEQRWGLLNDIRKLDKQALPMTVQRFIALGESRQSHPRPVADIPQPQLQVNTANVTAVLQKNNLQMGKPALVLCPGAEFGESKKWPALHYAELAEHYLAKDWQVWLMGSDNDLADCQKISDATNHGCELLAGRTTLPEAIDLMSLAALVVSNDSGLMHIAAALQKPLIAVYGSTDPSHTPPLSANHRIARLGLECSPCFKRECPLQHLDCLNQLAPQQVIELVESLL